MKPGTRCLTSPPPARMRGAVVARRGPPCYQTALLQKRERTTHGLTNDGSAMSETAIAPGDSALADRLRRNIAGEVLFDRADRGRYATDASIYQVEPLGVIVPKTIDDVAAALAIAREHGMPVLPRGGGTSQCGQTVNRALVIDCSKHLRRILHIDPGRADRAGRAGRRARPAQHRAAAAQAVLSRSIPRRTRAAPSAAWPATTPAARNPSATG